MRATVGPICWRDLTFWEACCLWGTQILGVTEMLPRLLQPSEHCPMLMFCVGVNNTTGNEFTQIKSYCKALGMGRWRGQELRWLFCQFCWSKVKALGQMWRGDKYVSEQMVLPAEHQLPWPWNNVPWTLWHKEELHLFHTNLLIYRDRFTKPTRSVWTILPLTKV